MAQFDYTARDFTTVKSELLDRASRALPEWTDRNPSDFMMALIDLWSYAADVMHYYIDRAAGESFLPTATQRESVLAFANLYDYSPAGVTSSTGTVTVFNGTGASMILPINTQFIATNEGSNFAFYSTSEQYLNASVNTAVSVRQGTRYTLQSLTSSSGSSTSNGQSSQRFTMFHKNIDPLTVSVYVYEGLEGEAVEWRQVTNIAAASATDAVYRMYTAADGVSYIIFGNGINGKIPASGVRVAASYAVSSGSKGNIPANAVRSFSSAVYPGLRIQSSSATFGGSDAESIDSIKAAIPRAIRAQKNAVTLSDFSDLAMSVPGVSKAVSKYEVGNNPTGGSVTVYAAPYQSDYLTAASSISIDTPTREAVYRELIGSAMLGVAVIAVPSSVETTPIYIGLDLFVKDNYINELVKSSVATAIDNLLTFSKVSFGQIVNVGEFYRAILAVDGVNYAVITSFNTTGIGNGVSSNGKITINDYKLPRKGGVTITAYDGVSPPI